MPPGQAQQHAWGGTHSPSTSVSKQGDSSPELPHVHGQRVPRPPTYTQSGSTQCPTETTGRVCADPQALVGQQAFIEGFLAAGKSCTEPVDGGRRGAGPTQQSTRQEHAGQWAEGS